jgi:threonine dehydratase
VAELVSLDEVGTAAGRLRGVAFRTPLIPFTGDVRVPGGLVIKPESLQPTGAFKLRGAYNAVYAVTRNLDLLPKGVVAHSSGNIDPTLLADILQTKSYTG